MSSDPAGELIACMDVLWEQLQAFIGDDDGEAPAFPSHDELVTAYWQVPELVWRMADELAKTHDLIDAFTAEQIKARQKAQSILTQALMGDSAKD